MVPSQNKVNSKSIYIVVPCYNEKQIIRQTISSLISFGYSIIVVNDGSSQNIYEEIFDMPIIYARHKINLGQGAALRTGTEIALKRNAEIIIHFDSDGQHSANDITEMIGPLIRKEADIVIGSRFLKKADTQKIPAKRRLLLRVARIVNGLLTGIWLTDAHNGFRAMNKFAAQKIKIKENRMAHASEILLLIKRNNLKYTERPTHIIYTEYSKAKGQSPFNSINIVIDIILNKIFR